MAPAKLHRRKRDTEILARISFKRVGWTVLTAASGRECIAKVETLKPDAIVLDVMILEMDGLATLKSL